MKSKMMMCGLMLFGLLACNAQPASAVENRILRVGLTVNGQADFDAPRLENDENHAQGYYLGTVDGTVFTTAARTERSKLTMRVSNGLSQVTDTDTGEVLYTAPAGSRLAVAPSSAETWFRGYKWNGFFGYVQNGGSFRVVNYVALEDYIKGVLPYEINADWPIEAQKAQAVCARSYGIGTNKHQSAGYDICNNADCQVYLGTSKATALSNSAVDATSGQTLTVGGAPVVGYFFSSSGGASESSKNVWGGDYAYLTGKIDPYETHDSSWTKSLTAQQVGDKLRAYGHSIGAVASVQVTRRTEVGNVAEVTVTDTAGQSAVITKENVRLVFGLNSIRFGIASGAAQTGSASADRYAASSYEAGLSTHPVRLDGALVNPSGYNIAGSNFYRLRDVAYLLNGTAANFEVSWNAAQGAVEISTKKAYTAVGGELSHDPEAGLDITPAKAIILLNGQQIYLTGYNINGNNYYRIRDIAQAVNFGIDFINGEVCLASGGSSDDPSIDLFRPTTPVQPTPPTVTPTTWNDARVWAPVYVFSGKGWGHSVGMSQWGAHAMATAGMDYKQILTFYYTGVEISA